MSNIEDFDTWKMNEDASLEEATIILDTVFGDDTAGDENFIEWLQSNGISHKTIGKSGGWPEVEYTGSKEALTRMAMDHFELAQDEIDELLKEGRLLDIFEREERYGKILENESSDYENWVKAIKAYSADSRTGQPSKYDPQWERMFTGSKMTARFLYRSIPDVSKSESQYEKDCKDFGKQKIDNFTQDILNVLHLK